MKKSRVISAAVVLGLAVLVAAAWAWAAGCGGGAGAQSCTTHEKSSKDGHHNAPSASGFLRSYFEMRSLLASDKTTGLGELSKKFARETSHLRSALIAGPKDKIGPEQLAALKDIEKTASAMNTRDIKAARESFKDLSRTVVAYVKVYGCEGRAYSFHCDMAKADWLQETDQIGNPYYGSQMPKCGMMTGHMMEGKYMAE
jgi:hypothetical protein